MNVVNKSKTNYIISIFILLFTIVVIVALSYFIKNEYTEFIIRKKNVEYHNEVVFRQDQVIKNLNDFTNNFYYNDKLEEIKNGFSQLKISTAESKNTIEQIPYTDSLINFRISTLDYINIVEELINYLEPIINNATTIFDIKDTTFYEYENYQLRLEIKETEIKEEYNRVTENK
jgi:hypothetical protein